MTEDTHQASPDAHDASDVDEAPNASRVPADPPSAAASGAGDPPIHERQDPDHIGVDWDLTDRTRD